MIRLPSTGRRAGAVDGGRGPHARDGAEGSPGLEVHGSRRILAVNCLIKLAEERNAL